MSWVRVSQGDLDEFIGPFPSLMHAQEFIERESLRAGKAVDAAPEGGSRYTVKEAVVMCKVAPGWWA